MGIDVNLYAEGTVTDVELATAEAFMVERFGEAPFQVWLSRSSGWPEEEDHRVEFCCMERVYIPGYERGSWPTIYGYIRAMQAAFPSLPVHYGGDSDDYPPLATDAEMGRIWQHWVGPHGDDYHREAERWNTATKERPLR